MNPRRRSVIIAFVAVTAVLSAGLSRAQIPPAADTASLSSPLPLDTTVTYGRLSNGIRYYIRVNRKPEKRAELRLAVNAGSVLEDDNQQGLAHFTEHMAFNGTRDFKKQELVNYLESVGVRFGADLNAYTSFDETVYMLQIPTDTPAIVEKGIDILENWAHLVSFEDGEIDKERGVVIEEWRQGRGAAARIRDKQFPILFKNSRYAERLPIGKERILESFSPDTLRQFYRDWYRPDLMAVIAVGDFDKHRIEALIRKHFSVIPARTKERMRTVYPVPDHRQTLYAIATDPEATISSVSIYFLQPVEPEGTLGDYRRTIVETLYNSMLNNRLSELSRAPDPPFLYGYSSQGRFVRSRSFYVLGAAVKDNGVLRGLRTLLTEGLRVRRFGFTQTELDRQKRELLRGMEQAYDERNKTESESFASEYIRNFLIDEPSPGIGYEYGLYRRFLPGITLEEVNRLAQQWITDTDRVVAVSAPQHAGLTVPKDSELEAGIDSVSRETLTPYIDKVSSAPLVASVPQPGTVVQEKSIPSIGVTEWRLSNGVTVVLKPTDFKNDEILFTSFGPGGTSLSPDSEIIPAVTASAVMQECGVGSFDVVTLRKMLAGKIVNVFPSIGDLAEGIGGSASPQDLPTMFQLLYLYFTAPRVDSSAFISYKAKMKGFLENRNARPESAFDDTIQVTMAQHSIRRRPFTEAMLEELNLETSYRIYRERFADASDFTFIFVGSFTIPQITPLVLTYLGGLPSLRKGETWRDRGIEPPKGVIDKTVRRGIEPKSQVRLIFTGPFAWSRENRYFLSSLASVLRIKLRELMREEKGGTYGVSVSAAPIHYPREEYRLATSWGCAPDRVDELTKTAFSEIDSLRQFPVDPSYITKVQEAQRRERETQLKENDFWLSVLQFAYDNHEDPAGVLDFDRMIDSLSPTRIRQAAREYLPLKNYVKAVLYPAEK